MAGDEREAQSLEETQNRTAAPEYRKGTAEVLQVPGQVVTRAPTRPMLRTRRSPQEKDQDEVERIKIKKILIII